LGILIKQALLEGVRQDIRIVGNHIVEVAPAIDCHADEIIDASSMAVIPGLQNCHTHSAMTIFRGYGDDLRLMDWLENWIWPVEAQMTEEDVYWGSKLACLEMIKSGTTAFLDMYAHTLATARAVEEMGLRAVLSSTLFDRGDQERARIDRERCYSLHEAFCSYSDRIQFSVGPHAIYTVSGEQLQFCHRFANEKNVLIHLHLSETEGEVRDCIAKFGTTPVRYLHKLGVLSPQLILAHSIWLDDEEMDLLAAHGCKVVHNPASNMKLASGYRFHYDEMRKRGIVIGLGTDGCSSSNNLDMIIAMKLAAFLGKAWRSDATAVKATNIYESATVDGARIMGTDAGVIAPGRLADLCLVRLDIPEMTPCHNFISNLVYSANGSAVDTTIVDGKILMRGRKVPGEEAILAGAAEAAYKLMAKAHKTHE